MAKIALTAEYEPNRSFSEVYTKLKLFEEIKKQLESENAYDASNVPLFKGEKKRCSKSVDENLFLINPQLKELFPLFSGFFGAIKV